MGLNITWSKSKERQATEQRRSLPGIPRVEFHNIWQRWMDLVFFTWSPALSFSLSKLELCRALTMPSLNQVAHVEVWDLDAKMRMREIYREKKTDRERHHTDRKTEIKEEEKEERGEGRGEERNVHEVISGSLHTAYPLSLSLSWEFPLKVTPCRMWFVHLSWEPALASRLCDLSCDFIYQDHALRSTYCWWYSWSPRSTTERFWFPHGCWPCLRGKRENSIR